MIELDKIINIFSLFLLVGCSELHPKDLSIVSVRHASQEERETIAARKYLMSYLYDSTEEHMRKTGKGYSPREAQFAKSIRDLRATKMPINQNDLVPIYQWIKSNKIIVSNKQSVMLAIEIQSYENLAKFGISNSVVFSAWSWFCDISDTAGSLGSPYNLYWHNLPLSLPENYNLMPNRSGVFIYTVFLNENQMLYNSLNDPKDICLELRAGIGATYRSNKLFLEKEDIIKTFGG